MTLKETAVGQTVKVKKLTGEGPVKRRIMDMGITKGVDVFVRKVAPLGDPIEVTVRAWISNRNTIGRNIFCHNTSCTYCSHTAQKLL